MPNVKGNCWSLIIFLTVTLTVGLFYVGKDPLRELCFQHYGRPDTLKDHLTEIHLLPIKKVSGWEEDHRRGGAETNLIKRSCF